MPEPLSFIGYFILSGVVLFTFSVILYTIAYKQGRADEKQYWDTVLTNAINKLKEKGIDVYD